MQALKFKQGELIGDGWKIITEIPYTRNDRCNFTKYIKVQCLQCNKIEEYDIYRITLLKIKKCSECRKNARYKKLDGIFTVGSTHGFWKIIDNNFKLTKRKTRLLHVKCKCGTERYIEKWYLKTILGCKKCTDILRMKNVGDLSGTFYSSIKSQAKVRKIFFDLSKEYLWAMFLKQQMKCAISGISISLTRNNSKRYTTHLQTASLDRIDSNKGYIIGNVQWVHKDINRMKSDLSEQKFKEYCKLITNYSPTK